MFKEVKVFENDKQNVWKYVFIFDDGAIAEAVLYRYNTFYDRTVICCSVMSGCPVGCIFCGTGANYIRALTNREISAQIKHILETQRIYPITIKKFQIMFMSMGEPMLNINSVLLAIDDLHYHYPTADLLISTVGINNTETQRMIIRSSMNINKLGLQLSLHASTDEARDKLIPFRNKLNIKQLVLFGAAWHIMTRRMVYINYICTVDNTTEEDAKNIMTMFPPDVFCMTFSVLCSPKRIHERTPQLLPSAFSELFVANGYNTRVFNPDGQDDIGGGCGQLWFVQDYLKNGGRN